MCGNHSWAPGKKAFMEGRQETGSAVVIMQSLRIPNWL